MKNKKKILSLIACLSLLSSCNRGTSSNSSCSITTSTPTSSVTPEPDDKTKELNDLLFNEYSFVFSGTNNRLNGFNRAMLPDKIRNLETIIIPSSVNGIKITAINYNQLGVFSCFPNLKTIKIPATVTSISYSDSLTSSPFTYLPKLWNIEVDSNNENFHVKGNCLIQKKSNTVICGWGDVEIPEEVSEIRDYAFYNNSSITSIKLHSKITSIGDNSFKSLVNLKNISSNGNTKYICEEGTNVLYDSSDANKKIVGAWGDCTIPGINGFNVTGFQSITSISIPDSVTTLKGTSFRNLIKLNNVYINSSRTDYKIDEGTNCLYAVATNVNGYDKDTILAAWGDVVIPVSVKVANLYYFESVTSVLLHDNITDIASRAFALTKIKKVHITKSVNYITEKSFSMMDYLEEITVDNTRYEVKDGCLIKKSDKSVLAYFGEQVIIPNNVTTINSYSDFTKLSFNKNVKYIKIGKGVATISHRAFEFNKYNTLENQLIIEIDEENPIFKIKSNCIVSSPDSDNETVEFAFSNNEGNIILPETAKKFNSRSIIYATNNNYLKSLIFNEGLEEINSTLTFESDTCYIEEIVLPSTLKTLTDNGYFFLTGASKIKKISIRDKVDGSKNEFYSIENNCLIKKGNNQDGSDDQVIFAYGSAIVPERIKTFDKYSLAYDNSLKSLTIHNNITSIIKDAFSSLYGLTEVNYIGTLSQFKNNIIQIISQSTSTNSSLYEQFSMYRYCVVNILDENGNIVESHLMSEI